MQITSIVFLLSLSILKWSPAKKFVHREIENWLFFYFYSWVTNPCHIQCSKSIFLWQKIRSGLNFPSQRNKAEFFFIKDPKISRWFFQTIKFVGVRVSFHKVQLLYCFVFFLCLSFLQNKKFFFTDLIGWDKFVLHSTTYMNPCPFLWCKIKNPHRGHQ